MEVNFSLSVILAGHTGDVRAVCFAGDHIVTGSRDCTARVWQRSVDGAGVCVATLSGHTRYIMAVAFTPPSERFSNGNICFGGTYVEA